MLRIAGQTAGPIGLKFVVDTQGWQGGVIGSTKFKNKKFHGQRRAIQLVKHNIYIHIHIYMLPIAGQTARLNGLNFFVEIRNFFQHFSYLIVYLFFKIKKKI